MVMILPTASSQSASLAWFINHQELAPTSCNLKKTKLGTLRSCLLFLTVGRPYFGLKLMIGKVYGSALIPHILLLN